MGDPAEPSVLRGRNRGMPSQDIACKMKKDLPADPAADACSIGSINRGIIFLD
jgi:hypothetical protein